MISAKSSDYISIVLALDDEEIRSSFYLITDSEIIFLESINHSLGRHIFTYLDPKYEHILGALSEIIRETKIQMDKYKISYPKCNFKVDLVLPEPYAYTISKQIYFKTIKPTKISTKLVEKLIDEIRISLKEKYDKHFKIVNEKIYGTRLNGYEMNDWQNHVADEFRAHITFTLMNREFVEALKKEFTHKKIHIPVTIHSSLNLSHMFTRDHVKDQNMSYITVYVDKDSSEFISTVRDFPFKSGILEIGYSHIHEKISNTFDSKHISKSILNIFRDGHDSQEYSSKEKDTIGKIINNWKNIIISNLSEHLNQNFEKIYIFTKDHLDHNVFTDNENDIFITISGDYDRQTSLINLRTDNIYFPKHIDAVFVRTIHNL